MKLRLTALALLLTAALTGCGLFGGAGNDLRADLDPTQIGFEVDQSGNIVVFANNVTFRNPPGAAAATVTGYEIQIYNEAGGEYLGIGSDLHNFHLAIDVPAGYICPDGESQECALGLRTPQSMTSEAQPFVFLDGVTALELLASGLNRLRADITFHAAQAGRMLVWTESATVTYPVEGE